MLGLCFISETQAQPSSPFCLFVPCDRLRDFSRGSRDFSRDPRVHDGGSHAPTQVSPYCVVRRDVVDDCRRNLTKIIDRNGLGRLIEISSIYMDFILVRFSQGAVKQHIREWTKFQP